MIQKENMRLEAYEIKKPDYDWKDRTVSVSSDVSHAPARYTRFLNKWVPRNVRERFFGKKDRVRISFVGDITCFEKQIEEAAGETGYDFAYSLEPVRDLLAQSDLVVGNLETMICPEAPYRGEKLVSEQNFHCNAPPEFLDAVRQANIDMVTTANNHDMDTGAVGIGETIDWIKRFGLIQTGTFSSRRKRYELIDVHGFRIAVTAFATGHNNKRCNLTKEGSELLLNDYSLQRAKQIHDSARAEGAEAVFVCIHWGVENTTVLDELQETVAAELAGMGYDCIIGSHPHVLQRYDKIRNGEGKEVPVFYSLGNFLSASGTGAKSRAAIACVDLAKNGSQVELQCSYIPVFTSKYCGEKKFVVYPLPQNPTDPRNIRRIAQIACDLGDKIEMLPGLQVSELIEENVPPATAKRKKPDPEKAEYFPIPYDNGKFVFSVFETEARLEGFSVNSMNYSYTTPAAVLGRPVTQIAEGAFAGREQLIKINFCRYLTRIPRLVCKDCSKLEGFLLGRNVEVIEEEAFYGCKNLVCATMRRQVRQIESKAFALCTSLRSVKIPVNVVSIAEDAFEGCSNAVFYCEPDSYGLQYAKNHGFPWVVMELE